MKSERPYSDTIAKYEMYIGKQELQNFIRLTICCSFILLLSVNFIKMYYFPNDPLVLPKNFEQRVGYIAASIIFFVILLYNLIKTLNRFKIIIGPLSAAGLIDEYRIEYRDVEVFHPSDIQWLRHIQHEYPDLIPLVNSLKNENNNITFDGLRTLWLKVIELDIIKKTNNDLFDYEMSSQGMNKTKKHNLWFGITIQRIPVEARPIFSGVILSCAINMFFERYGSATLSSAKLLQPSIILLIAMVLVSLITMMWYLFDVAKRRSIKLQPTSEDIELAAKSSFRSSSNENLANRKQFAKKIVIILISLGLTMKYGYAHAESNCMPIKSNLNALAFKFLLYQSHGKSLSRTQGITCDDKHIDATILLAAQKYGLDPVLVKSVIKVESDFNHSAISKKGAIGYMQLMPSTAKNMGVDPYDPHSNIYGGSKYLRSLIDQFLTWDLALASYNAGPEAVKKYKGIPPYDETKHFVASVKDTYRDYKKRQL